MERLQAEAGPYFRKVAMAQECAAFALAASQRRAASQAGLAGRSRAQARPACKRRLR